MGSKGGWENVEGEVGTVDMEEKGTLEEECWERIPAYLREGLAEGVRSVDAVGREVRGDGSLVGGGEEGDGDVG